ncbi:MAG TPA: hypothetical protein VGI03_13120 [Verrucomicrobiae bacterium]|jgi:hypothetical protein
MNNIGTNKKRTRNLVGQIPEPDELYGREDFIEHLWRLLEGNNILLLAPRRFGKSGVMRHIFLHPQSNFLALSFELEDVDSPEEFVWRVTKELLSHDNVRKLLSQAKRLPSGVMSWVKEHFDEAEFEGAKVKFKTEIQKDWRDAAKRMLTELEKSDQTVIFLFDELPAMLDRIIEKRGESVARDFLAWFRTVRLEQKDVLRRHRFIVAGSVGIDQILRKLGATDKLVDFARLTVEPLDDSVAGKLAEDLAGSFSITWSPQLASKMFELIGAPVPYFIHIFFSQLGQMPAAQRTSLTSEQLERIYRERVLGPTCRHYFDHYQSRLTRYGKKGEKAAFAILRAVAGQGRISRPALYDIYRKARGKVASEQEFDELMADLEYDWYLRLAPDTNEFYFRLKVMQDWWRRWYPATATGAKKPKTRKL